MALKTIFLVCILALFCVSSFTASIPEKFDTMTKKEKAAQLLIVGFDSKEQIVKAIKDYHIGGVILFKRNIDNRAHVKELIRQLQEVSLKVTGTPLMVCIDEEGGTVDRLVDTDAKPFSRKNIEWGDMYAKDKKQALQGVYEQAVSTAKELKSMGFNVNFAPVLDVCDVANNALFVKSGRSYGDDPEAAAVLGAQYIKVLQANGIAATAKHFPGHGSTITDTHIGWSADESSLEKIHNNHLVPFKAAIAAHAKCIMVSHVTYMALDSKLPATLSPAISAKLLREELGYKGMIVSDSLTMGAIQEHFGAESYSMCVNSGIDTVIIASPGGLDKGISEELKNLTNYEATLKTAIDSIAANVSDDRMKEACRQVINLKRTFRTK